MLKKIAIVGNIGAGKSTALKIFNELNCFTLSADEIVHELLKSDKDLIKKICDNFGKTILSDNEIDRKKLADIVFNNEDKLKKIESLIHPKVFEKIEKEYDRVKLKKFLLFAVEMPLLFEIGKETLFDVVVCVTKKHSIEKNSEMKEDYNLRKKRQFEQKKLEKLSDFVLENNQDKNSLKKNIEELTKKILGE